MGEGRGSGVYSCTVIISVEYREKVEGGGGADVVWTNGLNPPSPAPSPPPPPASPPLLIDPRLLVLDQQEAVSAACKVPA